MVNHEVIYGGLGNGKSSYAFSKLDPKETFKLGNGSLKSDIILLKWGSKRRHEIENESIGVQYKSSTLKSIIEDISKINKPCLLIDEWTSFFNSSFWWPEEKINSIGNNILDTIEKNYNIERSIYIASDYMPFMPFNLYKKRSLWNKILFKRANEITQVKFGIPLKIKD